MWPIRFWKGFLCEFITGLRIEVKGISRMRMLSVLRDGWETKNMSMMIRQLSNLSALVQGYLL
jgi:hypothetical protein